MMPLENEVDPMHSYAKNRESRKIELTQHMHIDRKTS